MKYYKYAVGVWNLPNEQVPVSQGNWKDCMDYLTKKWGIYGYEVYSVHQELNSKQLLFFLKKELSEEEMKDTENQGGVATEILL